MVNLNQLIEEFNKKWLGKSEGYIDNPDKTNSLLSKVTKMFSKAGLRDVIEDLMCLTSYVKDVTTGKYKDYSAANLAFAIAVLIYVVSPLDLIPDYLIIVGLTDDAALIAWACKQIHSELSKYRSWKSLQ